MARSPEASNLKLTLLCAWISANGREPAYGEDPREKKALGVLRYRRKLIHRGIEPLLEGEQSILDRYGLSDLFLPETHREALSNDSTASICAVISETGEEPRYDTPLGAWLQRRREGRAKVHLSDLRIADDQGYPNLFEPLDLEARSNFMALRYCSWKDAHPGVLPSTVSLDPIERSVAGWSANKRKSYRGVGTACFYPSDVAILNSRGYLATVLG